MPRGLPLTNGSTVADKNIFTPDLCLLTSSPMSGSTFAHSGRFHAGKSAPTILKTAAAQRMRSNSMRSTTHSNSQSYARQMLGDYGERRSRPRLDKVNGIERQFFGYLGRGVPYGPDDGTIAPWAVAASLPFAPEIVLPALDHYIREIKLTERNPYGFKASFNATYPEKLGNPHGWVSPRHCGLNQGLSS